MSILHLEGAYENKLETTGEFNPQASKTVLTLPSGQRVALPTEVILQAISPAARNSETEESERGFLVTEAAGNNRSEALSQTVIPLIEEQLQVGKKAVETARVRVRRETEEHVQRVSVPLTDIRWEVEHVPIDQQVNSSPEIRQVGETMIFPLVEERMIVTRGLWLREEVHVRKVTTVVEKSADFSVKRDVLVEERTDQG